MLSIVCKGCYLTMADIMLYFFRFLMRDFVLVISDTTSPLFYLFVCLILVCVLKMLKVLFHW